MTNFPIQQVRDQFPALNSSVAFFDNPAGTQVPTRVIEAVSASFVAAASNYGAFHATSRNATATKARAHETMAELLGAASGNEILIGQSTTMLTFQLSRSLGHLLKPGDEIIVTRMDHEANVSPWLRLAEDQKLTVRWLPFNRDTWRIEPADLKALITDRTRILALNYASNLTGSINPVKELTQIAKQAGALVYVDAVQFTPHGLVDVGQLGCDFLACSSYKFFGPHLGVLWGRESILADLHPYAVRTAPQDLPGRHGTGTPQTELLAGLAAATDYLAWLGAQTGGIGDRRAVLAHSYEAATAYEIPLVEQLIEGLLEIPGLHVHGITDSKRLHERVPTVSITHDRHSNTSLARALAEQGINVWCGNLYALEAVRTLGLSEKDSVLRIGLAHYNTLQEVERVLKALKSLTA
ncbi:cysteine desulfurase, SufS family [Caballeronia udeis]|uniref:Cysteine desulfurase, SufS family n=1 Tax=Caballeronia udeis TaxID=1232866 RepID=A0A158JHG8_9BURK|nr:cysteine desulfurase-like protein [Caballeronia udeis]SAL68264.1 cysteine desulfurase, SufS family [Caballeronia udeis]